MKNNKKINLKTDHLVFFDFETTGFYSNSDEIIEFGAVKFQGNQLIAKKQLFIKPKAKIPTKITEITGITDKDVEDALGIEDVIHEIKAWIGEGVLIAHNAKFDMSFLNQAYKDHGLCQNVNFVIDTLELSRIYNKGFINHKLETVAKNLGVVYEEDGSHRADYDADVLAKIFFIMKDKFDIDAHFEPSKPLSGLDRIDNITLNNQQEEANKRPGTSKQMMLITNLLKQKRLPETMGKLKTRDLIDATNRVINNMPNDKPYINIKNAAKIIDKGLKNS